MLVQCPGCKKTYSHGIGISNHQRKCPKLKIVAKTRLIKRHENAKKRLEAKISKINSGETALEMRNTIRERSYDFWEAGGATADKKRKLRFEEVNKIQATILTSKSDCLFS
jgi:exonuclease VII small subunit